ncbi:MAG TPA: Gfo/Idh/MocA family oxidoreductase [Herpetosiphonaceae bacterium]|nr:Gfo/Idh/MocA family oxidoreductase [Herpetosiphonaceae bacterium]
MPERKRYAVVGLGSRSRMFTTAILKEYRDRAELAAFCDVNQTRMDYYNQYYSQTLDAAPVATYKPEQFDQMLEEQRVNTVIVTSIDRTHHRYIIRAMELGRNVITEKPMTIDAPRCQAILDTVRATGRNLTVTFNYRYAPRNSKIKELLQAGTIGKVLSVHFEWLLDTKHGADYFRRWHRDRHNSGGLMVHKATHHFDLVNWWLDTQPATVFAMGDLLFYGRENAEERGMTRFYERAYSREAAQDDPFALHLDRDEALRRMYLEAEHEDGYLRDRSVFGEGISIEDDMSVLVRYQNRAIMTYHLTAYSPWEGYRVAFNGTKGRLEYEVHENSYVSGSQKDTNLPELRDAQEAVVDEPTSVLIRPQWGKPQRVGIPGGSEGGHGGGDKRMLDAIFVGGSDDRLGRAADHVAGAMSILTGVAANKSFATGLPVQVSSLVHF